MGRGHDLGDGLKGQDVHFLDLVDSLVGKLVQQGVDHLPGLFTIPGKVVALFHVLGPLPAGQRRLAERHVA